MISENCWGKKYILDKPETKVYRDKCCIACQPGEYLSPSSNSCINCEPGHACKSTSRKISHIKIKKRLNRIAQNILIMHNLVPPSEDVLRMINFFAILFFLKNN